MAYVQPSYVNLKKMPDPKKEYSVNFEYLYGGLNLRDLDYRIDRNESPEMKNLMFREGVLSCRDGQIYMRDEDGGVYEGQDGTFHGCYGRLWNDRMFVHEGNKLYSVNKDTGERSAVFTGGTDFTVEGSFFPYNEKLYYKTKGYYVEINYDYLTELFSSREIGDSNAYVPVTYINCSPANGSGEIYQPENRLSYSNTQWYNAAFNFTSTHTGSNIEVSAEDSLFRMRINTPGTYVFTYSSDKWTFNGEETNPQDYGITVAGNPSDGDTVTVVYSFVTDYYLPVHGDSITGVTVDGVSKSLESWKITKVFEYEETTLSFDWAKWKSNNPATGSYSYSYSGSLISWVNGAGVAVDLSTLGFTVTGTVKHGDSFSISYTKGDYLLSSDGSHITFIDPPKVTYPETNNTVKITYRAYNSESQKSFNNIMDCTVADVYGGTGALCIVMAGSSTQPNAYFWNGQTSVSMDPTYFPQTQYQLAGDIVDPIVGFGKQQGHLIIFNKGSIGRTTLSTEEVDERTTVDLAYVPINAKIGCDLPKSIQLIENNLVWCNTEQGVHFLSNTSAAYENNVLCLSGKVNTSSNAYNLGLLHGVREAKSVCSVDANDERYWLSVDDRVWVWDYQVSDQDDPAWFYFTNVPARGYVGEIDQEDNKSSLWHFDSKCRLTKFDRCFSDYDEAIYKQYRFATQYFNTYDTYKNVNSVIVNTRSDTDSVIRLWYITDYEEREDLTPMQALSWHLAPRDLTFRNLKGSGFAHVFRRRPMCRRVQYFTMRLENNDVGRDMSIVSATVYYNYQGKKR